MNRDFAEALNRILRARASLEQELKREPTIQEIAERSLESIDQCEIILQMVRAPLSLDDAACRGPGTAPSSTAGGLECPLWRCEMLELPQVGP